MTNAIHVSHLRKSWNGTQVFRDFGMDVEAGKITAIFGPNGSGKSTLLNILSGIVPKEGGEVSVDAPHRFGVGYIFQNYRDSLLPWRTNFENVALPLEIQGASKAAIVRKVEELQRIFDLQIEWGGYPYELSGGQQQILAFIRAVATEPSILFIDEPFSALDYENNLRLRERLQKYYLAFTPTILLVTHNIEEAVHLAHRIVVFSRPPTTVIETIENPLPYPRDMQSLKSAAFDAVKDRVLSVFQSAAHL